MAVPETRTPSKLSSQPEVGMTTRSPGTKSSEEIFSSMSFPRKMVTTSVDWTVDRSRFWFWKIKYLDQAFAILWKLINIGFWTPQIKCITTLRTKKRIQVLRTTTPSLFCLFCILLPSASSPDFNFVCCEKKSVQRFKKICNEEKQIVIEVWIKFSANIIFIRSSSFLFIW